MNCTTTRSQVRLFPIAHPLLASLAVVASTSEFAAAAAQTVTYKQQFEIIRSPDDVAVTPGAGGIAVVRSSERVPDPTQGPAAHGDEIAVVKTTDGSRAQNLAGCLPFGLTTPHGASDLIAISAQRAVLIGQHHWDGSEFSCVNVLDITDVYGAGPKCLPGLGGNWSKPNAGYVNDVAISPDGRYAVVNHKSTISVFTIDGSTVDIPDEFDTLGGDPSFQKNSIAMTQSRGSQSPIKCVVVTNVKSGPDFGSWVYVLDLSTTTPGQVAAFKLNSGGNNPPHDVQITPDDQMAVVSAGGVVALIDLSVTTAALRGQYVDPTAVRHYDFLADSLVVTNTQAVTIAADAAQQTWKADIFDISTSSLTHKKTLSGSGQPHDLARSNDGVTVVIRTTQDIVVVDHVQLGASSITSTPLASPSGRLSVFDATFDTVIVSRAWVQPVPNGQPGDGTHHYAAAIGRDFSQSPPGTRVEIVDLGVTPPVIVHTEVIRDATYPDGVWPSSIQLRPGGQSFTVRCNAAPHDIDPDSPPSGYDPATGEDVWFFTLLNPIGSVFKYEMTGSPLAISDPVDIGRTAVVNVASHYFAGPSDSAYVQTFLVND